jgi:hypothetical protein
MQSRRILTLFVIALLICVPAAVSAASLITPRPAQDKPADISGKYEGVAKSQAIGEIPLKVEIKNEGGKLSGKIDTSQGALAITGGTYAADGKIVMKFDAGGTEGTVTAKPMGDKIVGEFELGGQTGTIELKKVGATVAAAPSAPPAASAPTSVSAASYVGDWEASADVDGQQLAFTMKLKVDGQTVTGETNSAMGTGTLKGTFAGDKLTFALDAGGTMINFSAVLKDGKLTGEYELPGQAKGKWEAKKK